MIRTAIVLGLALALAVSTGAVAFFDDFDSYATGPLSVVSGGVWSPWGGNSTDAQVTPGGLSSPNAMKLTSIGTPDVVTYYGNIVANATGAFGFDFLVQDDQTNAETNDYYVACGSGNPALKDFDYGSGFMLIVDYGAQGVGTTSLHIWDLDGASGGGDFGLPVLAPAITRNAWHRVDVLFTMTVADPLANDPLLADGFFDVYLDGVAVMSAQSFASNNPLGFNATEVYGLGGGTSDCDYMLLDNFTAVPEPTSLFALAGFLPALAFLRKKR